MARPREFDIDSALDRAMELFWEKGYDGATLPDLTATMGISRPSLYAAFGDKQALFRRVLDRYAAGPAGYVREALAAPTARAAAERLLRRTIDLVTGRRPPRVCLFVRGALACGEGDEAIRRKLVAHRAAGERAIRKRFQRAQAEGDLAKHADPGDFARYLTTVVQGIAVQAAAGANRTELRRVAQVALRAWPV
jgi:AcrR family transcriptional regulator